MRGVNKVIIIGNLGADPESRQFNNGGGVTSISVATSEQWTDKQTGEKKEATEWHRVSLFNRLGEIAAQYLKKGSKVYIEGSLRTRKYQDTNGQDRYITEIRAEQMQMLDGLSGGGQGQNNGGGYNQGGGFNNQGQNNGGFNNQNNGGGYNQGGGFNNQGQNNGGFNNQGQNNGGFNNQNNGGFNNQGQQNSTNYPKNNQQGGGFNNNAPKTNGKAPTAMPDGPVDDDIPF